MRISVIIPYWEIVPEKKEFLKKAVASLKGEPYEIIVIPNEGTGMSKAVNQGLACASGDYFVVMNDDIELSEGTLEGLCKPNALVSPKLNGKEQKFWGCCFAFSREVYEKVGPMHEGYEVTICDDYDYVMMMKEKGVEITHNPGVNILSEQHQTWGRVPNREEIEKRNTLLFMDRWGIRPDAALS